MTDTYAAIPCAIMEPSFTDGVPVYAHRPETVPVQRYRRLQSDLKLGQFGDYLDMEVPYGE